MVKVHRVHGGDPRNDPHRLDPGYQQHREADVDKLRGDEQGAEPRGARPGGGGERRCIVPDEHERDAIAERGDVKLDRT